MIEPTEEMVRAYFAAATSQARKVAKSRHPVLQEGSITRAGLAAVLELVERDYVVLCGAARPLDDSGLGALTCNGRLGHDPEHRHFDGDWLVTWP